MRMILVFLVLFTAGAVAPANADERIFANGFEPCCTLGGSVTNLTGDDMVLHMSAGAINEDKPVYAQSGGMMRLYTFSHSVPQGSNYTVTVMTHPTGQTCSLSNFTGTMGGMPIDNIDITCAAGPVNLKWDDGLWNDAVWQ